jgi:hypothetical protein
MADINGKEFIGAQPEYNEHIRITVPNPNPVNEIRPGYFTDTTITYYLSNEELFKILKRHKYVGEKKRTRTWLKLK